MTGIAHLMMDDPMLSNCLIYHTSDAILGHIFLSIEIYRSSWSHMILITHEMHVELMVYCYLIVIPQWSLFLAIQSGSRFLIFRCHVFDIWTWFSCEYGWLGLHIWWWMIWCCLIFLIYHTSDAILGHISSLVEIYRSSRICMPTPTYEMRVELMVYRYLIMIP